MEKHIEARVVLLAAEVIRSQGQRTDEGYVYQQIHLNIGHDGYSLTLRDSAVTMTLLFHNKVHVDYRRMTELESFYEKLTALSQLPSHETH